MSGIVGWVNFNESLEGKKEIIQNMSNKLINRGPDSEGIFSEKHILLGHRRLIVVDPEGGIQPMTRKQGDRQYTIVYNGELYNTEDIRKRLVQEGFSFKSYSDTEVILVAYIAWGIDCVQHLNGIFTFAIWDEMKQQLFLTRDRLGVKPLFYTIKGQNFIFGSEIKALLEHPNIEPHLTEQGLIEIFALGPGRSPGSGVFKNIREIEPGYWLVYSKTGLKIQRYWQLESKEHNENFQETTEKLKELLVDAVEQQLVSDVPVGTFLSGGLDSSAISAIVANKLKEDGKGQLNTFSVDYVDNQKYFKSSKFQPDEDKKYIELVTKEKGFNHRNIVLQIDELLDTLDYAVEARDLPGMADIDSSLYLFCREVKKHATVALSGECADEIFGGYVWFRNPEMLMSYSFPWSQASKERRSILSKAYNYLPIEDYVLTKYEETIKEVPKLDGEDFQQHRMREMFYLNLKWFMMGLLNRKDRMSMASGLEVRVPFADHRIVEYVWNIPWEMKNFNGQEKGVLRKALEDILPKEVIKRKKSPYPKTYNPLYTELVQKKMRAILADKNAPILQVLDLKAVNEIVESGGKSFSKPWYGQLMAGPQLIAYLIQMNHWMKIYNVKLV
ncbi:asparagine synthase (glutamine-hydrolyzing) [Serpentinicella sp. ANB-PHB4]|uniref:asparagine synthase (glutamine-hydrolyzing) n=1 Tax=Serpentinicella sp. ANB-PHB4 TaxID=3074076 RepID=UPI00285C8901|nr:asparagine synthase (glutamine-hydrolyzing) [Serpentinicella sp. ANB-PHB4]MDR5659486.1 asparagine synthase (glutamine-hydrolyzing) [Serpentinicella sp. ANB-PHB4]